MSKGLGAEARRKLHDDERYSKMIKEGGAWWRTFKSGSRSGIKSLRRNRYLMRCGRPNRVKLLKYADTHRLLQI